MDTLDSPLDPSNANRYAYVAGDPINNIDPTGRETNWVRCAFEAGAAVTAIYTFEVVIIGGAIATVGSGGALGAGYVLGSYISAGAAVVSATSAVETCGLSR